MRGKYYRYATITFYSSSALYLMRAECPDMLHQWFSEFGGSFECFHQMWGGEHQEDLEALWSRLLTTLDESFPQSGTLPHLNIHKFFHSINAQARGGEGWGAPPQTPGRPPQERCWGLHSQTPAGGSRPQTPAERGFGGVPTGVWCGAPNDSSKATGLVAKRRDQTGGSTQS